MALNTLAFPTDIQWRRLCVSPDMLERDVCLREFPPRWRSSVAVFSYEPPEDQQTYPNYTVVYLKVSCSITGVQNGAEVGAKHPEALGAFNDVYVIEAFNDVVDRYYGCYGAILEVAVKPAVPAEEFARIPVEGFPYFIDFEPKKREVIELVTDTGERMSRTEASVGVLKGTTTTEGHEVVDTDTLGVGGGLKVGEVGLGGTFSHAATTKDMTGRQQQNIRTIDNAREMRESFSHTTQLAQMYHQFTGYHVGTNRAVFFMLPRPHILDREHTFVKGPRQLEGIQDVFLVMMRPKTVQDVCVEAYLETAHLSFREGVYEKRDDVFEYPIDTDQTLEPPYVPYWPDREFEVERTLLPNFELDTSQGTGFTVELTETEDVSELVSTRIVSVEEGKIVLGVTLTPAANHYWGQNVYTYIWYAPLRITLNLRRIGDEPKDVPQDLYLTGRGVCCCPGGEASFPQLPVEYHMESLLAEQPVGTRLSDDTARSSSGTGAAAANRLRDKVGEWLVRSVNSPQRYPRGTMSFLDSQLVGTRVADSLDRPDHADNTPVREIAGLDAELAAAVASKAPWMRRADLLRRPVAELRDRFALSHEQASQLRRAALGMLAPAPEPQRRWGPLPSASVPNLVGMSLTEARTALRKQRLRVGAVTESDSAQPAQTVVTQRPEPGTVIGPDSTVELGLASGLSVRVPDLVGRGVSEALRLLHEAGLRAEPELVFVDRPGQRKNTVLAVEPAPRTHVTPRARIVVQVASGAERRPTTPGR